MPKIICSVPERTPKDKILKSESAFKAIYAQRFGTDKGLKVLWMLLPSSQTFQAGKPADIFLAMIEVPNGLDQDLREPAMWAFTNTWAEILGLKVECLMVTCADADTVSDYMAGSRNRLRNLARPGFMLSTVGHIISSKRRDGFAQLRANL